MIENQRKKRGRPPVKIQWPDVEFTAQDVVETLPNKVSRVTIHSKLNQAVDAGKIKVIGNEKPKNGRPRVKYVKVTQVDLSMPPASAPSGFVG